MTVAHEKIWTKRFISLFIMNLTVFFVFYGLVTTLPLYALDVLGQTDKEAGLLLTAFLVSAIVVRPFSGKLLDVFGKRKLLLIGLAFYFVCSVLYLWIKPLLFLLALRFFHGIWFSIITTAAGSLAADIVPTSRKGAGLGYYTMSTNLAVVIGPFIGLLVIQYSNFNTLFMILSSVVLVGGLLALTINTDDLQQPTNAKLSFRLGDLFERPSMPVALIASLVAFSYASVLSFLSVYAQHKGLMAAASWFYAVFAAAMLLTRPYVGRLYDQKGAVYVIVPAFFFFGIGLVMLAYVEGAVLFLIAGAFVGIGYGSLNTSLQALAIQATKPERSSYATATYFTMFDVGIALGSYVLGIIALKLGYMAVYLGSAALMVGVLALYLVIKRRVKQPSQIETL
ncbi:MAG TPA: MFS transporter [Metalysinibacillus jejuensis]|uniref:MFS transporter n=1 Tax=Metalysinibacillus jejuensis TaxID=914327 RepID=A0A921NCX3_9BACL|nr:MFS transporter [Metalysinibacillus jejuensis]